MDERALAERLITYDTSTLDGIKAAAGFVKGWLESHEIPVRDGTVGGLPVLAATVGPESGPTIVLHGHLDVVPAQSSQFEPRIEGDRLFGRGAYDMKGGLAAMMCAVADLAAQDAVRIHFVCVFCPIDADIRYLPGQDADVILDSIRAIPDTAVTVVFRRAPAMVDRENPYVRALAASISDWTPEDRVSIGRDGASDANSFLDAGVPAVEFGPIGGGHHGPDEWVSITSLAHYRQALVRFVRTLPGAMGKGHLRIA